MEPEQNRQIEAYLEDRPLKEHQKEMIEKIVGDYPEFSGRLLDVGCAKGKFLNHLRKTFCEAELVGLDRSIELLRHGRETWPESNISLIQADAVEYEPGDTYDIITASGIMGAFEDFRRPMNAWLDWLSESGKLYIFGRFNSRNIDTRIYFRNHHTNSEWETGLNSYAICTISKYLDERNLSHEFDRFELGIDLSPSDNPVQTWTETLADGSKLVVNGANIIAEHHYLTVSKE